MVFVYAGAIYLIFSLGGFPSMSTSLRSSGVPISAMITAVKATATAKTTADPISSSRIVTSPAVFVVWL